jgi:hypothetical protein
MGEAYCLRPRLLSPIPGKSERLVAVVPGHAVAEDGTSMAASHCPVVKFHQGESDEGDDEVPSTEDEDGNEADDERTHVGAHLWMGLTW